MTFRLLIAAVAFTACGSSGKVVTDAKEAISRQLADPASAQFRDLVVSDRNGWQTVCGSVNAKNRFGGYVGFKRFGYSIPAGDIWFEDDPKQDSVSSLPVGSDDRTIEMARVADKSARALQSTWPRRCIEGSI